MEDTCPHPPEEQVTRVAHGHLGDAPKGTVQRLCGGCGAENNDHTIGCWG